MNGEVYPFRKKLFGGFNQQDVIDYVAKLAEERNAQSAAKEKAQSELQELTAEKEKTSRELREVTAERDEAKQEARTLAFDINKLNGELEKARQWTKEGREQKIASLDDAANAFAQLDSSIKDMYSIIKTASEQIHEEFKTSRKTILGVPPVLEQFYKQFDELREAFLSD